MKKALVLTLALVFAFASAAMAAEVGGELKTIVGFSRVDDAEDAYDGVSLDTAKLTVTAAEEGVFDASVTLKADSVAGDEANEVLKGVKLDAYELHIYGDLMNVEAWGLEADVASYGTALAFIEAPSDGDTVRFTSTALGPEVVADFTGTNARLFGKYAVDEALTIGGAANFGPVTDDDDDGTREYAIFGTGTYSGVTLSGEYFADNLKDENNTKYGLKAETTVSDITLTGKFVRDNNVDDPDYKSNELFFKAAYEPEEAPYTGSVAYTTKSFDGDYSFTKLELDGSFDVVPDFVSVTGSYLTANNEDEAEDYTFTWYDYQDTEWADRMAHKYTKTKLGAEITLTDKLTVEPSYQVEKIEGYRQSDATEGDHGWNGTDFTVTTLALDATYAITDSAEITYGISSQTDDTSDDNMTGVFHTLGVKLTF